MIYIKLQDEASVICTFVYSCVTFHSDGRGKDRAAGIGGDGETVTGWCLVDDWSRDRGKTT